MDTTNNCASTSSLYRTPRANKIAANLRFKGMLGKVNWYSNKKAKLNSESSIYFVDLTNEDKVISKKGKASTSVK